MQQPPFTQQTFIELKYLDHNPQKKSRVRKTVCEKTDYMCFPLHLEKMRKESKFWGKINLYCPRPSDWSSVGILQLYSFVRYVGPTVKKKEKRNLSIAGIVYRKPAIIIY